LRRWQIPVTAALPGIQARGFEIDPVCLEESRVNVAKNGIGKLVAIEDRDIFTLDLSRGPTVVTLYLLPSLNLRLLPQLQKLPASARRPFGWAPPGRHPARPAGQGRGGGLRRLSVARRDASPSRTRQHR
jgi:hypothetical protein